MTTAASPRPATERVRFAPVEGAAALFTPEFLDYVVSLHDELTPRVRALMAKRAAVLQRALRDGVLPTHPPRSEANTGAWKVPPVPADLRRPGIEISGPCSITSMFINALNPGPEGERAEGDLDDDEDSARAPPRGHRACRPQPARRRQPRADLHRSRPRPRVPDRAGRAPLLHASGARAPPGRARVHGGRRSRSPPLSSAPRSPSSSRAAPRPSRGQGIYFYLPKLEAAEECVWYRDLFDRSRARLPFLRDAVISAIPLVESLPAVYQMEEMLYALGPYAGGLNAARWDLKASIFEFVMADPRPVWPDRFGVDIKTTPFLADIFRRLVAVCLKRGAVPIGGMATALPSQDPEVNRRRRRAAIRGDKEWEAKQGFIRAWVAHIFHMKTAADPFRQLLASGWRPTPEMTDPDSYPVRMEVPAGPITVDGTRRNVRMVVEYLEGWLNGRGAKGIDSLARQARHPSRPHGGPRHGPDVGGPDRAAHPPRRARLRRPQQRSTTARSSSGCSSEEIDDILARLRDGEGRARPGGSQTRGALPQGA